MADNKTDKELDMTLADASAGTPEDKPAAVDIEKLAEVDEGTHEFDSARAEDNAEAISSAMEVRRKNGTVKKISEATPVNRASVKDIDMGLTGKIIPKTEEFERVDDIPQDASYEEKSRMLRERRRSKVDNFRLKEAAEDDEAEQEQDTDPDGKPKKGQHEFEHFRDEDKVLADIIQVKNNLTVRMAVLLFTGVFTFVITLANDFGWQLVMNFDKVMNPSTYLFTNTIMGLVSIAFSYTVIFEGTKNIFKGRPDCDSVAALGILISVISGIVTLFEPSVVRESFFHVYTTVAIFGLVFNTLGKLMIVKRTERNFRFVADDFDRYALVTVDNEDTAGKFTKGVLDDFPELATMRKTEFIKDFMKNSYSTDMSDVYAKKAMPLIILAGIAAALLSFVFEKNAAGTTEKIFNMLSVMSGTVSLCSSMSLMLIVNVPLGRAQNKYLQYSGVMLGYSAVDKFADTNSVLIDAEQLFPKGMVDFKSLKLLGSTKIEDCILMSASLASQAGSILSPVFYRMLRGKTEMLYPVESYIYEDGLGLSGWIENKRVLFGSRELMENHSIDGIPTKAKEKEYSKGNTVLYLSVSGVVSMLFVVQAKASRSVSRWLRELGKNDISAVVRTVDGFITKEYLSELFDCDEDRIRLLPFRYHKDYVNETEYTPKVSSPMLCSGHFPSFAMLLIGTKRLKQIASLGVAIQAGALALGVGIAIVMTLLGTFGQLTPTFVLLYNLGFLAVTLLAQHRRV